LKAQAAGLLLLYLIVTRTPNPSLFSPHPAPFACLVSFLTTPIPTHPSYPLFPPGFPAQRAAAAGGRLCCPTAGTDCEGAAGGAGSRARGAVGQQVSVQQGVRGCGSTGKQAAGQKVTGNLSAACSCLRICAKRQYGCATPRLQYANMLSVWSQHLNEC
jgi:hypothetical protein